LIAEDGTLVTKYIGDTFLVAYSYVFNTAFGWRNKLNNIYQECTRHGQH